MLGLLPPSSSVSFLRLPAAAATISLPTSVEPVKATLSTPSCAARAAPAVSPKPVTTLTTPLGMPASAMSSARRKAVSGVCSAGLRTTQLPAASAGPSFQAAMRSGKFHGMIWPTTPTGSRSVYAWKLAPGSIRHGDVDGVAFDLRRPTRHVVEKVGGQWDVGDLGDAEWLAVVERLKLGELVDVLEDEVADLPDNPSTFGRRHARPGAILEGRGAPPALPGRCPRRRPRPRWRGCLPWRDLV